MEPQNSGKIDIEIPPSSVPNPTPEPTTAALNPAPANEPPKITGLSSSISKNNEISGKALPPSTVINKQPEPVQKPKKTKVQLPPPTEEEIEKYLKKKRTKRTAITVTVAVLIFFAAVMATYLQHAYHLQMDNKYSDGYSVNYPYVIKNNDGKSYIVSNGGKKISSDYDQISDYYEGYAVACNNSNCDILDINGNKSYSGEKIEYIPGSHYFLEQKSANKFGNLIDSNGKNISDEKIITLKNYNNRSYLLSKSADAKSYSLINSDGKKLASGTTEDKIISEKLEISYSKFEDKYYCAASIQTRGNEYETRLVVFNCESGKQIISIDNIGNTDEDRIISDNIFKAGDNNYIIFNDDLVLKTDLAVTQTANGLIYGLNPEEGFELFNPRTKNYVDENSHGLIDEGKYDIVPNFSANDYFAYANYRESKFEFFDNGGTITAYKDGKKKDVKNITLVFSEELFNYLHSKGKDYVVIQDGDRPKIYDINKGQTLDLGGDIENVQKDSSLVVISTGDINKKKIYNLITGKSFEITLQDYEYLTLDKRYIMSEKIEEPSEGETPSYRAQKIKYYSQTGKLLAEISYNIDGE